MADTALAAFKVSEDPHLPEVTCQVLRLSDIEEGKSPGPPCRKIPKSTSPGKGIGLRHAVGPLRVAVKAREKPLLAIGFVAVVTLSVFAVGYAVGRRRRT